MQAKKMLNTKFVQYKGELYSWWQLAKKLGITKAAVVQKYIKDELEVNS